MRRSLLIPIILASAAAGFAAALSGCGSAEPGQLAMAITGTQQYSLFSLSPTANTKPAGAADIVSAVVVVNEIDARVNGAWIPVMTTPHPIDLLKLDNKTIDSLGIVKFPLGHISELRLKLDDHGAYVVLKNGDKKPLELPDSGIVKVVGKLDLDACTAGIVILDFDPKIKIEDEHGHREYELRCVARIRTEELHGGCGDMGGSKPDLAQAPDLAGSCGGVVCPMGQICQFGNCVADPCNGVVCPMGQVCKVVGGAPICVADPCAGVVCPTGQSCNPSTGTCQPNAADMGTVPDMAQAPDMAKPGDMGHCHK